MTIIIIGLKEDDGEHYNGMKKHCPGHLNTKHSALTYFIFPDNLSTHNIRHQGHTIQ